MHTKTSEKKFDIRNNSYSFIKFNIIFWSIFTKINSKLFRNKRSKLKEGIINRNSNFNFIYNSRNFIITWIT
jgi:hypothetical protein